MAKYEAKTKATKTDPLKFIDKVESEGKRRDSHELVAMMRDITGVLRELIEHSIAEIRKLVTAKQRSGR